MTGRRESFLPARLTMIRDRLERVGAVAASRQLAVHDGARAAEALAVLPGSRWRTRLAKLVKTVAARES